MSSPRIGLFTRLLEEASAADRYRFALEQISTAERLGFASAWLAQHHFHEDEGGLPSPWVLLGAAAARTTAIRLGTGVITLPLEDPIRVAEDAAVVDAISGGRVELGIGTGGTPSSFLAFGLNSDERRELFAAKFATLLTAFTGGELGSPENHLYPAAPGLERRLWQATFSAAGAALAGDRNDGLMLSRSQPRPADHPEATLVDIQQPIVEAYEAALPEGGERRLLASRTVVVVDEENRTAVLEAALPKLRRFAGVFAKRDGDELSVEEVLRVTDSTFGTPDEVIDQLRRDTVAGNASEVAIQVHSLEPGHEITLRSLELFATVVAPALGWGK
ncbi:MAG: putative FMN-dependent luciferase-like monooxygenase [Arachnia sp.]